MSPDLGRNAGLDRIGAVFDWRSLEALVCEVYSARTGRPSWPPLVLFKALLLQQWYGLSDPGLEEALGDRLSFRKFVGLGLNEGQPDHSTLSRFRKAMRERGLDARLFDEVERQLGARGLLVKSGTLLDATLVDAAVRRPGMPTGSGSSVDPDAAWTRKGGKSHFGYKAHIGVDEGSGLIRRAELAPARINDSVVADALICGDERAIYADKAYEHKERRQRLKSAGIKDRIMHRSHKNQAQLPHWQAVRNRLISPIRSAIERVFGTLKRSYGYRRVRYCGLAANHLELRMLCIAFNMRKATAIIA
ncbi:IS5 family transposase [Sphingobium terrigena]|uniref:IS5 family transposase n=1 Tax=Sphingobium terrigena TaxID=2304063 RepID=UPI001C71BE75|nr:IS5 family transposase [Sphingobium terrigena]